jgi:hypothetical protein
MSFEFIKYSAATTNRISFKLLANSTNWKMWHQDFKSNVVAMQANAIKETLPPQ